MSRLLVLAALVASSAFAADPAGAADGGVAPLFVPVQVIHVLETGDGFAVLLLARDGKRVLPVFVGEPEGVAIRQRLEQARSIRPMTHDLLEAVITALDAKLLRVEIDDLKAGTFLGRLVLEQGKKLFTLDARPSDAIALALGLGAPIVVSQAVMEAAALPVGGRELRVPPVRGGPQTL